MERIADYIIRKLAEAGASHLFMISGRGILYLTDAVARNPDVSHVCTYHEQSASYAAMAYAAASGRPSVCLVSTGCAAANAVTACLCAYQDNLPVIFVSGNNQLAETTRHTGVPIRTYGAQEADIIGIVHTITKYAVMLETPETAVYEVEKAIWTAQHGRQGPVWIDLPLDVQNMRIDAKQQMHFVPPPRESVLQDDVRAAADALRVAKRPVLLFGSGARQADIGVLAEALNIPAVCSPAACDIYGTANRLSIGVIGAIGGSRAGNFLVQNADFILAVGIRLCSQETGRKERFAPAAKRFVVDIDPNEHTKDGVRIDRLICADAAEFVEKLLSEDIPPADPAWTEKALHWKTIFSLEKEPFVQKLAETGTLDLYLLASRLSDALPENASVLCDAGFEELIVPSAVRYGKEQRCFFPAAQGAMGFAIPAVIGAHCAGRKHLICIVGDGSFMMNMQELPVISAMQIPVSLIVINNNMYAVIRRRQKDLFRSRTIGNDPSDGVPAPDLRRIADCFGFSYHCIRTLPELTAQLASLSNPEKPTITEVFCTPEQNYLHESYGKNENGRLEQRPIDDLSPFLDRSFLKREMLAETEETHG